MPTMMSALPSRATSSRIALGRAPAGINGTLAGWPDHRLWQILQNDRSRVHLGKRMRGVDPPREDVQLELGKVIARIDVAVAHFVDERRAVGDAEADALTAEDAGALDQVEC